MDDVEHANLPVVVVGAGAAGLMAAIASARSGTTTILLDTRRRIGAKILISGGTRCNVTNVDVRATDFNTPSVPFVRNVLRRFDPERTRSFFEDVGVSLKLETTGKYFPVSDSAKDVLAGLLRGCSEAGVALQRETRVEAVDRETGWFVVHAEDGRQIRASAVVICTGGLSFPETGSDGRGYGLAQSFGHRIVRTSPALTPFVAASAIHGGLAGMTLPARLTVRAGGRVVVERTDSFLFTHTGYSGPVALDVSRHWIREGWTLPDVELRASFMPNRSLAAGEEEWLDATRRAPSRKVSSLLAAWVPARLAGFVATHADVDDITLGAATRAQRRRAIAALSDARLPVTGVMGYRKAEVTAGGIALAEVVARNLESKKQPGLFFAGEILDVDGYIGGFNFQWAWSSGWVAGSAAADHARSCNRV